MLGSLSLRVRALASATQLALLCSTAQLSVGSLCGLSLAVYLRRWSWLQSPTICESRAQCPGSAEAPALKPEALRPPLTEARPQTEAFGRGAPGGPVLRHPAPAGST